MHVNDDAQGFVSWPLGAYIVDAKQFSQAVLPAVLADIGLELVNQLLVDHGVQDAMSWILTVVSLVVLPIWAGVRVARAGSRWYWWCVGGLCVLASTALVLLLLEPSLAEFPLPMIAVTFLVLLPLYALFGFLGGKWVSRRINGA